MGGKRGNACFSSPVSVYYHPNKETSKDPLLQDILCTSPVKMKKGVRRWTAAPAVSVFILKEEKETDGMKKTYKIEVDCANCANLMENTAQKVKGVANATVNFMTQKMIVEFEEGADPKSVMPEILKACKKVEPDCEIMF